jgi:small conductance mechanosensitive channel
MLYSPLLLNFMPNSLTHWTEFTARNGLHLLGILAVALLLNRLLRVVTNVVVKRAVSSTRVDQMREQQTRTLAGLLYSAGTKLVWAIAILTALPEFGINVTPIATLAGLASLAVGFGAQNLVRDIITGCYIILEDQYIVGDWIQVGEMLGRVEHITLRRTVVRDPRGALVTIANGDIRTVSNLSRDWSQAFVDVALAPDAPLDKTMSALESAAAELRSDPTWSQALVDGPRVLGVQSFDRHATTVRLQIRTMPTRADEVSRELRRRIQGEFLRRGIPVSMVQRWELAAPPTYDKSPGETTGSASGAAPTNEIPAVPAGMSEAGKQPVNR